MTNGLWQAIGNTFYIVCCMVIACIVLIIKAIIHAYHNINKAEKNTQDLLEVMDKQFYIDHCLRNNLGPHEWVFIVMSNEGICKYQCRKCGQIVCVAIPNESQLGMVSEVTIVPHFTSK